MAIPVVGESSSPEFSGGVLLSNQSKTVVVSRGTVGSFEGCISLSFRLHKENTISKNIQTLVFSGKSVGVAYWFYSGEVRDASRRHYLLPEGGGGYVVGDLRRPRSPGIKHASGECKCH